MEEKKEEKKFEMPKKVFIACDGAGEFSSEAIIYFEDELQEAIDEGFEFVREATLGKTLSVSNKICLDEV